MYYIPSFSPASRAYARTDRYHYQRAAQTFSRRLRIDYMLYARQRVDGLVIQHLSECEECLGLQQQFQDEDVEAQMRVIRWHIITCVDWQCVKHQSHGKATLLDLTHSLEKHLAIRAAIVQTGVSLPNPSPIHLAGEGL